MSGQERERVVLCYVCERPLLTRVFNFHEVRVANFVKYCFALVVLFLYIFYYLDLFGEIKLPDGVTNTITR